MLRSSFPSIDAARTRSCLHKAEDNLSRRNLYAECFLEGSVASAEAAAQFAFTTTSSEEEAFELAEIINSLPSAVSEENAPPLAKLAVFLAASFTSENCLAPLQAFCYTHESVQRACLTAVNEKLHALSRENSKGLVIGLQRMRDSICEIVSESTAVDRYTAISDFANVAVESSSSVREEIFDFLWRVEVSSSPILDTHLSTQDPAREESLIISQLSSLTKNSESRANILMRSLIRSFELNTLAPFLALWNPHRSEVLRNIPTIGADWVVLLLFSHAARAACLGRMQDCRIAMEIGRAVFTSSCLEHLSLHVVTERVIIVFCASVGAASTSCGANDVGELVAEVLRCLRGGKTTALQNVSSKCFSRACIQAQAWKCPITTLLMGVCSKIMELWQFPRRLATWITADMEQMLHSPAFSEPPEPLSTDRQPEGEEKHDIRNASIGTSLAALFGSVAVSLMAHDHSGVRLAAVTSMSKLGNSVAFLFCLPSILLRFQHETNGVVAARVLSSLVVSRSLLRHKETAPISLNACFGCVGNSISSTTPDTATYQGVLATLGSAAAEAPGLANSILLKEIQKLKGSFGLTRRRVRIAASAAILRLVKSRPSRGPNFVPFISLCITSESMEVAPEAASVCFAAMTVMAEEEVLDPIKAVKIVMKSYPDVLDVKGEARRSYIELLGSAAKGSTTRKGIAVARRVIPLLRRCVSDLHPLREDKKKLKSDSLSWCVVGQAAKALEEFSVEEILRQAYEEDQEELDPQSEKDRKDRIEAECKVFVQSLIAVTGKVYGIDVQVAKSLRELIVKIVSHEWENRQRSKFDPDKIAKLRAASDALRRARQTDDSENQKITYNESFKRAVAGLPVGVVQGLYEECCYDSKRKGLFAGDESFAVAIRTVLAAKVISPALPWVGVATEILQSQESGNEERASCLALIRSEHGESFELTDARARWFGPESPLFAGLGVVSRAEAREMYCGMVQFYPRESIRLLHQHGHVISCDAVLDLIDVTRGLSRVDVPTAAEGIFLLLVSGNKRWTREQCISGEKEFFEIILERCPGSLVEDMLDTHITDETGVRLVCKMKDYELLRKAAKTATDGRHKDEIVAQIGRTLWSFDAAHRREFVIDVCAARDKEEIRDAKLRLAAYALGVGALLPDVKMALSAAVCVCEAGEREAVARTVATIMGDERV